MVRVGKHLSDAAQRRSSAGRLHMGRHRRHGARRQHGQQPHHRGNRNERHVPAAHLGKDQPQRNTGHGRYRERGHHDAHRTAAPLERDHVSHDGLRQGRQDTPECPRQNARHHERAVGGRHATGQCGQPKQDVEDQQQPLAPEPVDVGGGQQPRHPGRERVGRHQQPELRVADGKQLREPGPQRHHDHEVKDVGELNARQGEQQPKFAAGSERRGGGHRGRGQRWRCQIQGHTVCRKLTERAGPH